MTVSLSITKWPRVGGRRCRPHSAGTSIWKTCSRKTFFAGMEMIAKNAGFDLTALMQRVLAEPEAA